MHPAQKVGAPRRILNTNINTTHHTPHIPSRCSRYYFTAVFLGRNAHLPSSYLIVVVMRSKTPTYIQCATPLAMLCLQLSKTPCTAMDGNVLSTASCIQGWGGGSNFASGRSDACNCVWPTTRLPPDRKTAVTNGHIRVWRDEMLLLFIPLFPLAVLYAVKQPLSTHPLHPKMRPRPHANLHMFPPRPI